MYFIQCFCMFVLFCFLLNECIRCIRFDSILVSFLILFSFFLFIFFRAFIERWITISFRKIREFHLVELQIKAIRMRRAGTPDPFGVNTCSRWHVIDSSPNLFWLFRTIFGFLRDSSESVRMLESIFSRNSFRFVFSNHKSDDVGQSLQDYFAPSSYSLSLLLLSWALALALLLLLIWFNHNYGYVWYFEKGQRFFMGCSEMCKNSFFSPTILGMVVGD